MKDIRFSDDKAELQMDVIHGFLTTCYWSPGISRRTIQRGIDNSWCVGAYDRDGTQIGVARLITDRASFAWLADVFVVETARGRGLSKTLVAFFTNHPELTTVRRGRSAPGTLTACTGSSASRCRRGRRSSG